MNAGNPPPQYLLVIGKKAKVWTRPDCGLSSALRFSVQFEDDSRLFVKAATDRDTEKWLRREHLALFVSGERIYALCC
jgi:hypothetical protein